MLDNYNKTELHGVGTWERTNDPNLLHEVKTFKCFRELQEFLKEEEKAIPIKISKIGEFAFVLEYTKNTENIK